MDDKKSTPLAVHENKPGRVCSVCGTATYSRGGIHPQCAQAQAEASRIELFKAMKKVEEPKKNDAHRSILSPWQKLCPKCRAVLHTRKVTCECGHRFGSGT
jgi:hypothetical protein